MKRVGARWLMVASLAGLAAQSVSISGCSKGETSTSGHAGTSGSGPGVAGTTGSGSAGTTGAGTAGTTGTGTAGTTGTGTAGTTGTGTAGTTGSGTAGTTGSGTAGTTGTGTAGAGGTGTTNTLPATFAYLFNNAVEGWVLNNYADTGRKNLADPASGSSPALTFDGTTGDPASGSLKVTATFTDWKQYVDAVINVSPPKNLPGRVLRARVKLVSGSFGGGAQIHAGTGSGYKFAAGAWTTLTVGNWVELDLDLDAARVADTSATFDPTMVVQIGVHFDTGGDGLTTAFSGPVNAVFQIDTVSDGVVGDTLPPLVNDTFDTGMQSWALSTYDNSSRKNLGGPNSPTTPVLSFDSAVGQPSPGSLKLAVTYSDYKQYVDPTINLSSVDLTGKVIHAWVFLDSGDSSGGVQLHAGSGPTYTFAAGAWTTLDVGIWTELTLDLTAAAAVVSGFAPGDIRQIGVQFDTGDGPEGGTFGSSVDTVYHLDSVTAQ